VKKPACGDGQSTRGEYVAGIPKPMTRKQFLAALDITEREARLWEQMATDLPDEAAVRAFMAEKSAKKRTERRLLAKQR
jgi:hypothetical protein